MNRRILLPALTTFFCMIGGFVSFYVAQSQVQFASLNYVFFALAALCAGIGLLTHTRDEEAEQGVTALTLAMGGVIVWAFISSLASGRFASTIMGMSTSLVGLGALVCFALIGAFAMKARSEFLSILGWFAPAVLLITALYGLIAQPVVDASGSPLDALHLGFANSSELAMLYVLLVPFVLMRGYAYIQNEKVERLVRYAIVMLAMVSMVWNAMRMALIVVVLIALYYLACELLPRRTQRRKIVGAAGGVGIFGALILVISALSGGMGASFLSIRGQLWRMAAAEIAKRPILGYGADGFFGASATIAKPANWFGGNPLHLTDGTTDPHNFFVLMAVSFGVVGLVLILVTLALWAHRALAAQAVTEDAMCEEKISKSKKKQQVAKPEQGYFSAPFVAGAAGILLLLTMPTTINLVPLLALCMGCALMTPCEKDILISNALIMRYGGIAVVVMALAATCLTGADAAMRFSLGGITYLQGPTFAKAYSANKLFGWDPFIAHELNTAYAYSTATGTEGAREAAQMVARNYAYPTLADTTNPYFRLMYLNVLYKLGRTESPLTTVKASPEALRFDLLKKAAIDFPAQPDVDIELALSASNAENTELAQEATERVRKLGAYAESIWAGPLKSLDAYFAKNGTK